MGYAYYNLGEIKKADEHFRKALSIMGITIPADGQKVKNVNKLKINQFTYTASPDLEADRII